MPRSLAVASAWVLRLLILLAGAWAVLHLVERLSLLVIPFTLGILLSALVRPPIAALRRRGLPAGPATPLTALGVTVLFAGALTWISFRAASQLPLVVSDFSDALNRLPLRQSTLQDWQASAVQSLEGQGDVASRILSGLRTGLEAGAATVLTFFVTVYLAYDGEQIWAWSVSLFPPSRQTLIAKVGEDVWERLSGWLRGTALVALFHGLVVAVVLLIMGVPLVASLAFLVFLGSFVPIVGSLIFGGIATLVTFATRGTVDATVLIVVLLVDSQIEAHLLQPFLIGRYVRLHPLAVAAAVTAGGLLVGIPGALFAVPLTAAVHAAARRIRSETTTTTPEKPSPGDDEPETSTES